MDQHGMYGTVWNVIYDYAICMLFVVGSISEYWTFEDPPENAWLAFQAGKSCWADGVKGPFCLRGKC